MENEKIKFKSNEMSCFYHKNNLNNPYEMERLAKELQDFQKTFFNNGEVIWSEFMNDEDVLNTFQSYDYLQNSNINKVISILDKANLLQEDKTIKDAFKEMRIEIEELKQEKIKDLENELKPILSYCEIIFSDDSFYKIGLKKGIYLKHLKLIGVVSENTTIKKLSSLFDKFENNAELMKIVLKNLKYIPFDEVIYS